MVRRVSGSLALALTATGVVIGLHAAVVVVLLLRSPVSPTWVILLFPATGLVYAAAGLVAWRRRPNNLIGLLLVVGSLVWLAASLVNTDVPVLVAVGQITATLPVAVVIHLVLAFPSGRLRDRWSRLTVALAYAVTVGLQAPLYLFGPGRPPEDLLSIADRPDLVVLGQTVQRTCAAVLVLAMTVIMVVRLRRSEPAHRRVLLPLVGYGVVAVVFIPLTANLLGPVTGPLTLAVVQVLLLAGVPVAFALSLLRGGFARTGEIAELGAWLGAERGGRPSLTEALAETLGDPSLRLVFAAPDGEAYLDAAGQAVAAAPRPGRALVDIVLGERRVGAIDYDATLIADPETVRRAGRVVAIAVDHERLSAEVLASRDALRESRARIVVAGDTERRRIARDLHDGLQARLIALALTAYKIGHEPTATPEIARQADALRTGLDAAATELRHLVHGVMPALLIERGLYAATEDLVDRMPLPTGLRLSGDDQGLAPTVQSTAYFTVSEGLSNAIKHARASRLDVHLHRDRDRLQIEVADDGIGGAAPGGGLGLRGLADRLDVLGGTLRVESLPRQGTRLIATVPCGS